MENDTSLTTFLNIAWARKAYDEGFCGNAKIYRCPYKIGDIISMGTFVSDARPGWTGVMIPGGIEIISFD